MGFPHGGYSGAGDENLKDLLESLQTAQTSNDPSGDSASLLSGQTPGSQTGPMGPSEMGNPGSLKDNSDIVDRITASIGGNPNPPKDFYNTDSSLPQVPPTDALNDAATKLGNSPIGKAANFAFNPVGGLESILQNPALQAIISRGATAAQNGMSSLTGGLIPPTAQAAPAETPNFNAQAMPSKPPIPPLNGGAPNVPTDVAPGLGGVLQKASQMPDTDYNSFKMIGADDRMKLAQQQLEQQKSVPNAAINAVAGIGDALARSYGHDKEANASGDVQKIQEGQREQQLGALDTERTQKMQDFDNHIKMQMNDPNGSLAHSMRAFGKTLGLNIPSGMTPALIQSSLHDAGEMLLKKAIAEETATYHRLEIAQGGRKLSEEARKTNVEHPVGVMINKALGGDENAPSSGGWKVIK